MNYFAVMGLNKSMSFLASSGIRRTVPSEKIIINDVNTTCIKLSAEDHKPFSIVTAVCSATVVSDEIHEETIILHKNVRVSKQGMTLDRHTTLRP